ncbi:MAG: SGNH/GDSL hydrolase family protein [Faecousia sp.]
MWWILAVIAVLAITQIVMLGMMGGIGPLGFLHRRIIANAPGNKDTYSLAAVPAMDASPLEGRKICILGSSVAYGAASMGEAVGEYLAARLGAKLFKETVSGTTLTESRPNSYVQRMKDRIPGEQEFALFLCQLSTNDATRKCPLGEISPGRNLTDFDTAAVTGALEYIICYARQTWGCPVVFFTGSRYDSPQYRAMVKRLLELREKWGIGVLDLWSDDGFNDIPKEQRSLYMMDWIHPTKAGYRDWWGPELERQLLQIL